MANSNNAPQRNRRTTTSKSNHHHLPKKTKKKKPAAGIRSCLVPLLLLVIVVVSQHQQQQQSFWTPSLQQTQSELEQLMKLTSSSSSSSGNPSSLELSRGTTTTRSSSIRRATSSSSSSSPTTTTTTNSAAAAAATTTTLRSTTITTTTTTNTAWTIPQGSTPNLPAQSITTPTVAAAGNTTSHHHHHDDDDDELIHVKLWRGMLTRWNVRSLMDVGCCGGGRCRGVTPLWFALHGASRTVCVRTTTIEAPPSMIHQRTNLPWVHHDYTRGPWWPDATYDAVWVPNALWNRHLPPQYVPNLFGTFRKAALIVVVEGASPNHDPHHSRRSSSSSSKTRLLFTAHGFLASVRLTRQARQWIRDAARQSPPPSPQQSSTTIHITNTTPVTNVHVFVNPAVASLPWHAHLLFEHGCFKGYTPQGTAHQPCGKRPEETPIPTSYLPLLDNDDDDDDDKTKDNKNSNNINNDPAQQQWERMVNNPHSNDDVVLPHNTADQNDTWLTPFDLPPGLNVATPLAIPRGSIANLPSIRVDPDSELSKRRKIYGGRGDRAHLGGFTSIDTAGISPQTWRRMVTQWGIKSVLDIGCGRGISTLWFHLHGLRTQCVEGSHDAVEQSVLLPRMETGEDATTHNNNNGSDNGVEQQQQQQQSPPLVVEHDFSRGPWWPEKTYDAVWCVEFLEHVGVNLHFNYVTAMRKAALIFATSSRWGGWHHVEVHSDEWWIQKFESYGFIYDDKLTQEARGWAGSDRTMTSRFELENDTLGRVMFPQHLRSSLKVFLNPAVAALPEHAHILYEAGCLQKWQPGNLTHRLCLKEKGESPLPQSFLPLDIDPLAQGKWEEVLLNRTVLRRKGAGMVERRRQRINNPTTRRR